MRRLAREHEVLVTVEEGAVGGFGSHVLHFLADDGAARQRPEGAPAGAARRLHRPGEARKDVCRRRASTRAGIVRSVFAALGGAAASAAARA